MLPDIRWVQRFRNFQKAFGQLAQAVKLPNPSEMEVAGLIRRFEFTYELAWKVLKDYLNQAGFPEVRSPRDTIRRAFEQGLITDGAAWLQMLDDRNLTTHTYDEATALKVETALRTSWYGLLTALAARLEPEVATAQPDQPASAATPALTDAERTTLGAAFAQVPGLEKVVLFGSRAKGTHRPASDVDLALYGPVAPEALAALAARLGASTLPYLVDVVPHQTITSPDLLDHIERAGIVVWLLENPTVTPQGA